MKLSQKGMILVRITVDDKPNTVRVFIESIESIPIGWINTRQFADTL